MYRVIITSYTIDSLNEESRKNSAAHKCVKQLEIV